MFSSKASRLTDEMIDATDDQIQQSLLNNYVFLSMLSVYAIPANG
jgi:hypothetical protein